MEPGWAVLIPAALLLLVAGFFLRNLWRRDAYPFHSRTFLLTKAELEFFHVLERAVPLECLIAPKVRLGDLIQCSEADWARGHGPRISAKHLDFTLMERRTGRILLALELDDSSHRRAGRRERDIFIERALEAASVPLLRVPAARAYDAVLLKRNIESFLADSRSQTR